VTEFTVSQIIFFLVGLGLGSVAAWLLGRRSQSLALELLKRDYEAREVEASNQWGLREQALQHEAARLQQVNQELSERCSQSQQALQAQTEKLGATQQELAAAREKSFYSDEIKEQLRQSEQSNSDLRSQQAELTTRLAAERANFTEQLALLKNAKSELTKEFENVANKIFDHKQQQFSQSSKTLLDSSLDPLKMQLGEFRRKVEDVYEKENAERNRLAGQIVELQKQAQKIGEDAVSLAQALKGNNKTQGNWGEVVLERILEQSGLQKGREYDTQVSFASDDGSRRMPDVIVYLPEGKHLIIDAKVSLVDYEKYSSSTDDAERRQHLNQHVLSLRNHIRQLSIKDYEKLNGIKALDFIFIFIPVEAAFMAALQHEPELYREAYDRHIILVSPTTLLATLRTVENIWRYEKQNKNAELIAEKAGGLHDQFVLLLNSIDGIGVQLDRARDSYDKARKQLHTGRGNLVRRAEELRKLGAKTKKQMPRELLEQADDLPEAVLLELADSEDDEAQSSDE
jgi:DNA recombination protein RmuC